MKKFSNTALAGLMAAIVGTASYAGSHIPEKPAGFGNRPLTMIVPYGAGGGSDQLSRAMAKAIEEETGLSFQVVNKPGGGGTAAIPDFMISPPDGFTVMEHIDTAVAAYAKGDIRENPAKDWIPICIAQITFSQIYIRPDETRYTDWESLVAYIDEHPDGCCQTNEPKHQYSIDGYFYEITKERHSVRAASRLSLNVLRFESDLCELNRL